MFDTQDPIKRSRIMAAIHSKDTSLELWLRSRLHAKGFRYRLHVKKLLGQPDIVFPKYKCVIFINGCFWHMHRCSLFHWPKTRASWWRQKLERNYYRDLTTQDKLREQGWRVLIVWECAIKGKYRVEEIELIRQVAGWIVSGGSLLEIPSP
ncbi:very short patch repair endonuclease [Edaphovirga cremea]|uniref:very short patch repair endonuclease n=1 Tax=Edaphovirga cremea TaxID=2267246 RepID=UPI00398A1415